MSRNRALKSENSKQKRRREPEPRQPSVVRSYLEAFLIAGLFLGFTNTFVFKTFYIPSASMEDSLLIGDHLFVNRYIFGTQGGEIERRLFPGRDVRRGDVVVFRSPERPTLDLVKRCVALPGDKVEIRGKDLYINGAWVDDDSYTKHTEAEIVPASSGFPRDNFGPFTVPEEHYFCLGDNRDRSNDSRFWGAVPRRYVKGQALLVYWSYGGETPDGNWYGWGAKLKQLSKTAVGFLTKTRWSRTFHLIR